MFLLAASIIGLAASAITIKTLIGYTKIWWLYKLLISGAVLFCWFGHSLLSYCRHRDYLSLELYKIFANLAYVGLGFGFVLLVLLLVRDFSWFATYGIAKISKSGCCDKLNPFNTFYLNVANIATVALAVVLTGWGMYQALKQPEIKTVTVSDKAIVEPFKLVQLSDLHINRTTPTAKIKNLVSRVNALNADAVVITGDVVDEPPHQIKEQMTALSALNSKYGTFMVFGNHDFYSGMLPWLKKFADYKLGPLFNNGVALDGKIYIAGIPDKSIEKMSSTIKINLPRALSGNKDNLYTVLLSHTPNFSEKPTSGYNLQLSGHTHGGQIFPFHLLVKAANKYLAGLYPKGDGYIYVSRGAGFWGPPLRILAPSEITVINLEPQK